ncbi:protein FAM177A1-like isoform X2 [Ischnura elegans]|uniref:protein FAM177A1-like isoform X2 n=1 Tax=Ischnura elegans TaxID=197161 RepID=UPI001ED8B931|nr:protein FAM177A1-like isoform X2 [Ischnura elegans]
MSSFGTGISSSLPESTGNENAIPGKVSPTQECSDTEPKTTRKIIHFCDGALEECGPGEDEQDGASESAVDPSTLTWGPWIFHQVANAGSKTLKAVDYVGESLANFFGITTPKYQYEIDEYEIACAEEEEEKKTQDLEMGGWTEGSAQTNEDQPKHTYSTEVSYEGPIKLQPNTVQS